MACLASVNGEVILAQTEDETADKAASSWTSFHNGGNASMASEHLPVHWSPDEGIAWQNQLPGYGQSAPVIWNNRIYVTAIDGDKKEHCLLLCLDAISGHELWRCQFKSTTTMKNSYMVSRAAPTPLVDANGIYALFESGDLHAVSHSGEPQWHRALFDDAEKKFQNGHGYGSSPAQSADAVIVLADHQGPSSLTAISKSSGEILWQTDRTSRSSWTSPHVTQVGKSTQVIVSSGGSVDGYDAMSGKQLWSRPDIAGNLIPSATVVGDLVFVGASESRRGVSPEAAAASNCCLRIRPDMTEGFELLWKANKAVCHYISPLVHDGFVYYVNNLGVVRCLEASTGQEVYATRMGEPCWAQPVAVADRLYFFGKRGVTKVVRAGAAYELLAENRLWPADQPPLPDASYEYTPESETDSRPREASNEYMDPLVYAAVPAGEAFIVRLGTHLFRIDGKSKPVDVATEARR
jgi:outer membrane protein assembly factor BamB